MKRCALTQRGVVEVLGPEAKDFLQGLITNDIEKLTAGSALYTALLTPQGKYLFDFFVVASNDDALLLDCEAARISDLLRQLTLYKLRAKVELRDLSSDLAVWAVFEPEEPANPEGMIESQDGLYIYADPRHPAMGWRVIGASDQLHTALTQYGDVPLSAYHAVRLALGIPESGIDLLPEKTFPLEANLEELNGVDHHKGCYIGQEVTSRTKRKGTLKKRLLPVNLEGVAPAPGTPILAGASEVGTLLSAEDGIAVAMVRIERWQDAVEKGEPLIAGGTSVTVLPPDWIPDLQ